MFNYILPAIFLLSVAFSVWNGTSAAVTASIFSAIEESVKLTFSLLGMFCFWDGIMALAEKSKLTEKIAGFLSPLLRLLFPRLQKDAAAKQAISMNLTANLFGIGNAATPLGLRAMQTLRPYCEKEDTASNEMVLFVILNTASLRLIPTTVAFLRAQNGSSSPMAIFLPALLTSLISCFGAVFCAKLMERRKHGHIR